jgi:hypothetical protein
LARGLCRSTRFAQTGFAIMVRVIAMVVVVVVVVAVGHGGRHSAETAGEQQSSERRAKKKVHVDSLIHVMKKADYPENIETQCVRL